MRGALKICLLVSGNLGLEALLYLFNKQSIICVFTDRQSTDIIQFAKQNNIQCIVGNPRNKTSDVWQHFSCDLLLSVNYLFIIERSLTDIARYAINIHGSLLPKYRGRTPHVWAIINGERKTGITAHLIDENVDTGDIVAQKEITIERDDTGGAILQKFKELYPVLIEELLEKIQTGTIEFKPQDNSVATYFGKRTPEHGLIQWYWFRERIGDWIRAQADPYPGAFFFYEKNKIIVHKAILSDLSMNSEITDGTILKVDDVNNALIVKTPNGCIELRDMRYDKELMFKTGIVLNN